MTPKRSLPEVSRIFFIIIIVIMHYSSCQKQPLGLLPVVDLLEMLTILIPGNKIEFQKGKSSVLFLLKVTVILQLKLYHRTKKTLTTGAVSLCSQQYPTAGIQRMFLLVSPPIIVSSPYAFTCLKCSHLAFMQLQSKQELLTK